MLGVQARLTGRAKTGKELINDSSSVATAKVVLWNTVRALLCCAIYPCAVNSQSMLQGQYKHCLPVLLLWHLLGVLCQLSCWPEPLMMYCRGDEAYQPDEYGPTITFARKIRRCGTSEYYLGEHGCKVIITSQPKHKCTALLIAVYCPLRPESDAHRTPIDSCQVYSLVCYAGHWSPCKEG